MKSPSREFLTVTGVSLVIAFLVALPGFFMLAHFPQSPDGAEMVSTALQGGVLHPSGMPVQAWLNRLFILLSPETPAWGLSFFSWCSHIAASCLLLLSLRRLGASWPPAVAALIAYSSYATVWAMAIQPEKYAFVSLTIFLYFYCLVNAALRSAPCRGDFWRVSASFALAVSQHSACVFLLPSAIIVLAADLPRNPRKVARYGAEGIAICAMICFGFYSSLLLMRADRPWPDWGYLTDLKDVANHFLRKDFAGGIIISDVTNQPMLSGLDLLGRGLIQWTLLVPLIPFGLWLLFKTRKSLFYAILSSLVAAVFILITASLPAQDQGTAIGYGERYQLIVIPLLALLGGIALASIWSKTRPKRALQPIALIAVGVLGYSVHAGYYKNKGTDNNVIEIYRNEAGKELPAGAIFISANEIDLFYGVPCEKGVCFPLKNMFGMEWYHFRAAPNMEPRVTEILSGFNAQNWNYPAFLKKAFAAGYPLATPTGHLLVGIPDLRPFLEQRGLIWTATPQNRSLYTDEILRASVRLCASLASSPPDTSLPKGGLYFTQELLQKIGFVFIGAGDYLSQQNRTDTAHAAYAIAQTLQPGIAAAEWQRTCNQYKPF